MVVAQHGLKTFSESARKLLSAIGVSVSGDTVLRDIHRMSVPSHQEVREIGVDDWAFRKGATGRDITEVADRFHLNINMSDCVRNVISSHYEENRRSVRPEKDPENSTKADSWQVMFNEVKELQAAGLKIAHIVDKSIRKKKMQGEEASIVERLMPLSWFRDIHNAAATFYDTIMGDSVDNLTLWLKTYAQSPLRELLSFAYGIQMDLNAVQNAITMNTSNGIVEGYVNKLKAVKRTMYGRASLALLKRKIVFSDLCFN